ncbi:MAG TPA: hypothetical protein PL124_03020 [Candidatus Cloacimonadota bacterium]|nr:hypothetical protein [Candidatus Cloacimonadota bacterium]HPS38364.1 hypothetical protein [Candidatus Cloacimonadota bacterium]
MNVLLSIIAVALIIGVLLAAIVYLDIKRKAQKKQIISLAEKIAGMNTRMEIRNQENVSMSIELKKRIAHIADLEAACSGKTRDLERARAEISKREVAFHNKCKAYDATANELATARNTLQQLRKEIAEIKAKYVRPMCTKCGRLMSKADLKDNPDICFRCAGKTGSVVLSQ